MNSDIVAEKSAFVTQATWFVPEKKLESDKGNDVKIGHFSETKE